ncbi:MAG TPA: helix-turn-helix domain-containing protein [Egicoccus sp.]|nr:helix-turn-helix domain-containing protein [Egicoccus sp.]HSK22752.1 helix-turn-helix domain-containing protein [Egicoccus sp.]
MPAPLDFDVRVRTPTGPLARAVEGVWHVRGTVPYARERIAPTGSTVAVIILGDPIRQIADDGAGRSLASTTGLLIGPHDRPIVNEPLGETHVVVVVTTPVGAGPALGVTPAAHRRSVDPLLPAWRPARRLRDRLLSDTDPEQRLDLVVDHLDANLDLAVPGLERCERAVALLEAQPTRPVSAVAAAVGVSPAQLGRDFARVVGLSPRVLARLLRVRRLLEDIDGRGSVDWGGRAAELGWYDQSHLIRDFRRHTGVTPSAYLAAQRLYGPLDDDAGSAGFVPEP